MRPVTWYRVCELTIVTVNLEKSVRSQMSTKLSDSDFRGEGVQ
jgi:hypothetical protein